MVYTFITIYYGLRRPKAHNRHTDGGSAAETGANLYCPKTLGHKGKAETLTAIFRLLCTTAAHVYCLVLKNTIKIFSKECVCVNFLMESFWFYLNLKFVHFKGACFFDWQMGGPIKTAKIYNLQNVIKVVGGIYGCPT